MITEVDKYRGWDISFDTKEEAFTAYSTTNDSEVKKISYSAIKKYIDEFLKDNQNFKPFYVVSKPDRMFGKEEKIKVIGMRKDNGFVGEKQGKDGIDKFKISVYDESRYIVYDPQNDSVVEEYNRLCVIAKDAVNEAEVYLKNTLKVKTLVDIKNEYLNK